MDRGHETSCLAEQTSADEVTRRARADEDFAFAARPLPPGWRRRPLEDSLVCTPPLPRMPTQGWQVHVSAAQHNAPDVLDQVGRYCIARALAFAFVRSAARLAGDSRCADRGSRGRFVTIYPADDEQFEQVVTDLDALVGGEPGPDVLGDLRIAAGPVSVRYGGFIQPWCIGAGGRLQPAIEHPGGEFEPEQQGPTFAPPRWVALPEFLQPQLRAKGEANLAGVPYRVSRSLYYSGGGGVYLAEDIRTGRSVVLKRAGSHGGPVVDGQDAMPRLRAEAAVLRRLAGLGIVPEVVDEFSVAGEEFLVLEDVDGTPLSDLLAQRYPLAGIDNNFEIDIGMDGDRADHREQRARAAILARDYTDWALARHAEVTRAVESVHGRRVVLGTLHPSTILVRPDGRIALIDLENAGVVAEAGRPAFGDPAFSCVAAAAAVPPGPRAGFDPDHYALACLALFMFLPMTALIALDPDKAAQLAADIPEVFPVPAAFLTEAVQVITGRPPARYGRPLGGRAAWPELCGHPNEWKALRESLTRAILASATPHRPDRLFPGDVRQSESGGLNLAYGAAGVLYALSVTGAGVLAEHEQWLVNRARDPGPGTRFGLYDGLPGVAWALDWLGRPADALAVLDRCTDTLHGRWDQLGADLFGGLSGIGLSLAYFAERTGEAELWSLTEDVAQLLADGLDGGSGVPGGCEGARPRVGLMRGSSGPALLFLRLYERVGAPALLDLAATALRRDLRRCTRCENGSLEVNQGYRTMPYLADGSAGIGMVLKRYLQHASDDGFAEALAGIRGAAGSQFCPEAGLLSGRAGMIALLADPRPDPAAQLDPVVAGHVQRLRWHAVNYQGHLAFPGKGLLRLSMDLATGSAGVLLALGAAMHDDPVELPLLGPARTRSTPTS